MKLTGYAWYLFRPPFPSLALVSTIAWLFLMAGAPDHMTHSAATMHATIHADYQMAQESSRALLNGSQMLSWLVMVVAMMFPLLNASIRQIWERSLPRRRSVGISAFLVGYLLVWSIAGILITWLSLQLLQTHIAWLSAGSVLLVTLIWQASPWKQAALNRCHFVHRIAPFGWQYFLACIHYGTRKGFWCVSSCWVLMMLPMVFGPAGLALMLFASVWMFFEQLAQPRPPRWRMPFARS